MINPSIFSNGLVRSAILTQAVGAAALSGCSFHGGAVPPVDGDVADAVLPSIPSLVRPATDQALPGSHAFLLWRDVAAVTGQSVTQYEICSTTGPLSSIDEDGECPGSAMAAGSHFVLDPLTAGSAYLWKVRAHFEDASVSAWSAVGTFSTDNSLAAWWRLNGTAMDSGPSGNNGTLQNGAGFGNGIDAQALQCDGVDDYVDLGGALTLPGPLTLSAWIYGNGIPTNPDTGIVNKGTLNYALTYHTNGRVYFYIGEGANNLNALVDHDSWHHVVGTFDGTTNPDGMRFYVDGAPAGSKTSLHATTGASGPMWIGRYSASYFRGLIDNVTVYNSALDEPSVLNEYCATQAAGGVDPLPAACNP